MRAWADRIGRGPSPDSVTTTVRGGPCTSCPHRRPSRRPWHRRPLVVVAAVLGGLFLLGAAAEHPWLFIVLAVLGIVAGFGFWTLKSAQRREEQQRQEEVQRT